MLGEEKFRELLSTNFRGLEANRTHPNQLFQNAIFRPLGGAVPPNFCTL